MNATTSRNVNYSITLENHSTLTEVEYMDVTYDAANSYTEQKRMQMYTKAHVRQYSEQKLKCLSVFE